MLVHFPLQDQLYARCVWRGISLQSIRPLARVVARVLTRQQVRPYALAARLERGQVHWLDPVLTVIQELGHLSLRPLRPAHVFNVLQARRHQLVRHCVSIVLPAPGLLLELRHAQTVLQGCMFRHHRRLYVLLVWRVRPPRLVLRRV